MILKRGDKAAGVQVQEGLWFVIRVYFDVLVLDAFFFEHDPGALHEGTEPARVEFESVLGGVSLGMLAEKGVSIAQCNIL